MKYFRWLFLVLICLLIVAPELVWASVALQTEVIGVDQKTVQKNINSALQTLKETLPKALTRSAVMQFNRQAPMRIKKAMQPFGYFRARVTSGLRYHRGIWFCRFQVTLGPVMRLYRVELKITGEGSKDVVFGQLRHNFPIKSGQTFNIKRYQNAEQALFNVAANRGYFQAKMIRRKIIINLAHYRARIIMHFNTGPRYRFGDTFFTHTPLNVDFLKRYLAYKPGQFYSQAAIERSQQNLLSSNYFQQVVMNPLPKRMAHGRVPIKIRLTSRQSKQYVVGVGYGTDAGIRGTLGLTLSRLNAEGHHFRTLLQGSKANSQFAAEYDIPGPHPATDLLALSAGAGNLNLSSGKSRSIKLAISYSALLGRWQQVVSLIALSESYRFTLKNFPINRIDAKLIYPDVSWQYLIKDYPINPRNGLNVMINLAGTVNALTSKTGFLQAKATAKLLKTFERTHTRFLLRGTLGRTEINQLTNLPLSLQLLTGGARSIRGFKFDAIGPGRNIIVASVEIQQRIVDKWYVAGFYDVGNVTNLSHLFQNLNQGAGPGIVWMSPIGPVEITLGYALNLPSKPWRIQFSMGPFL